MSGREILSTLEIWPDGLCNRVSASDRAKSVNRTTLGPMPGDITPIPSSVRRSLGVPAGDVFESRPLVCGTRQRGVDQKRNLNFGRAKIAGQPPRI